MPESYNITIDYVFDQDRFHNDLDSVINNWTETSEETINNMLSDEGLQGYMKLKFPKPKRDPTYQDLLEKMDEK